MYTYIYYIYIYIYTHTYIVTQEGASKGGLRPRLPGTPFAHAVDLIRLPIQRRGKILHTRNRHLRNHGGFSVARSNGLSVAFSNGISLVGGMLQRIVTCPVDFDWNLPMELQVAFSNGFSLF